MTERSTHETVIQRRREVLEVEPDVERARRRDVDLEAEVLEALEHVVALRLEVLLQRDLLALDVLRVEEGNGGELEAEKKYIS